MKVDFTRSYRGVLGKVVAESMVTLSKFTRGATRGGYGQWSRGSLQICGLVLPKEYLTTIDAFIATCRSVKPEHIAKLAAAADVKYLSSKAADKKPVERLRDAMKTLDCEAFTVLASAVEQLQRAGFTSVEIWLDQPDGTEVSRIVLLSNFINDTFYRNVSNAQTCNAVAKHGIGNGRTTASAKQRIAA